MKNLNKSDNKESKGLIVLVNGSRDDNGDAWIGDFSHDQPFWAALLIPSEKEDSFYKALDLYEKEGGKFEIQEFASEIVKEGVNGRLYPSEEQLAALKLAYGDIIDNTHDRAEIFDDLDDNQTLTI